MTAPRPAVALFLATLILFTPAAVRAQEAVVFEGRPIKKVTAGFEGVREDQLSADQTFEYQLRIVERNGKFFWASRQMKPLIRTESGAYITYVATDGSGYIRVGAPMLLDLRDRLPPERRAREIGYVEHLVLQFASVNYYGNRAGAP